MSMPACSHVGHKSLGILKKKNENKDKLVMNAVEERIQETNKLHDELMKKLDKNQKTVLNQRLQEFKIELEKE